MLIDEDSGFKTAASLGIQTVRSGAVLVMAVGDGLITSAAARKALSIFREERYISASVDRAILKLLRETAEEEHE